MTDQTDDASRRAFENRRIPNLDLKRNEDGSYRYQAAQLAFRDFVDGWQAATAHREKRMKEKLIRALKCTEEMNQKIVAALREWEGR